MTRNCLIYGLLDLRTGELRYVGQSTSGLVRPRAHALPSTLSKEKNTHKANWIRLLQRQGLQYEILIVEECSVVELDEYERFWISYFRFVGCRLLNLTDGGGGPRGLKHSAESRTKMSVSRTGRPKTPEHRAKIAAGLLAGGRHKGKTISLEHRVQISIARGGGPFEDETGQIFRTQSEAARAYRVAETSVAKCLHGKRPTVRGHTLKYIKQELPK